MAEAPVQTPEIPPDRLEGVRAAVSRSVNSAVPDLEEPTTLWEIARRLSALHEEYGGGALELERDAERRPGWQWLVLVAGLYDRDAVAKTKSEVIDGPLTLLGFARLDPDFDALLRRTRVRRRLERILGYPLEQVERLWARAAAPVELLPIWTFEPEKELTSVAVDPRGRWLAAGAIDGTVLVYDLATGDPTRLAGPSRGTVRTVAFSPDGSVLTVSRGGNLLERWTMRTLAPMEPLRGPDEGLLSLILSPDGTRLLAATFLGSLIVFDLDDGTARSLPPDGATVTAARFSHDGTRLATGDQDGVVRLSDAATGEELLRIDGLGGRIRDCALTADHRYLAVIADVDGPLLWRLDTEPPRSAPLGPGLGVASACEFSPDGSLLAIAHPDGPVRVLDLGLGLDRMALGAGSEVCRFGCGGRLLFGAGDGGLQVHDVVTGEARLERGERSAGLSVESGLVAEIRNDVDSGSWVVQVWEEVAQSRLPAVVPDAVRDEDLVGVDEDASALADVIAAVGTEPPLSIGLFGDWGSGKSFLIRRIQTRVRRLAVRSRGATGASSYCRYIRNIEFNAWQYAEGNLWASLVTHLFDELAKPEPAAGVSSDDQARQQVARLEAALAARSGVRDRLDRARAHADQAAASYALRRLTWGLAGADGDATLATIDDTRSLVRLVLPHRRAQLIAVAAALAVAASVAVVLALVGVDRVWQLVVSVAGAIGVVAGWIAVAAQRIRALIQRVGPGVRVAEVQRANLDAELAAARASEAELQQELSDLAAGRRIARFAAERSESGDYRSQLGVVSRIHDDFERMSDLLAQQRQRSDAATGDDEQDALPRIDRIVLYIDDLDRCPPKRVVEVLEAVHLILALPLFVVVIAVDPRWLLQSLRLHYSQLLAGEVGDGAEAEDEEDWRSTPLNYVEKIIQVPFALRPMTGAGAQRLVHGLLPVHGPQAPTPPVTGSESTADGTGGTGATPEPERPRARAAEPRRAAVPAASLTPRTLGLTTAERDFAAEIAASLATPRAIKKFTNLYRLLRARLDDYSGQLDRFLDDEGPDIPEYEAVLILIAMVLANPDNASEVLLKLLDDTLPRWHEIVDTLPEHELAAQLAAWTRLTTYGKTSSCEPFGRWALEVSRYSFETGQQVFARSQNK